MPEFYEIRIKGRLDQRWSEWFAGLKVTYLDGDETLLSGVLPDQAAFFGLLERIRDLNLVLLSVNRQDPASAGASNPSIENERKGAMPSLNSLVKDFLAQKKVAVVGISEKRDSGCNLAYDTFKARGYQVSAVNPHQASFHGDPCYPDLKSIPDKPGAVFILANPAVSEQIVQQCIDLGIKRVWMHCFMGTRPGLVKDMTSVSQKAVDLCRQNGIAVIPGACPNQFLNSDPGHSMMRFIFGLMGFHRITV